MMKNGDTSKLFVIIGSLDIGGTENHLLRVMPKLQGNGLEISIIAFRARGALANEMERKNVPVLSPPPTKWIARQRFIRRTFIVFWLGFTLARERPNIVHFFLPEAYLLGGVWSFFLGIPFRIMSRRSLNFYQKKHPLGAWIERYLHKTMDVLVGNSKAIIRDLEKESANSKARIQLIYNGIDPNEFVEKLKPDEVRRELNIPAQALVFITVANFIPYKGHKDLLKALAKVKGKLPDPWRLICVGRNDGILNNLEQSASHLGISQNVIWLSSRRDIYDLMKASDIGISSSHEEGLSNSVLEGMALGIPMIVTDVGGNTELITDQETGLVVPARSPSLLGEACEYLAQNAELRNSMKQAGKRRALSKFSMEVCVSSYFRLYNSLTTPG
ncbi:MAG: hypothetical protein CMM32_00095 [Rhodospirillaceae bacterium]|nr:hypothetical protein [Rhodospirillaceae bacterium]